MHEINGKFIKDTHHFDINISIAACQILQRFEEIRFGRPRVFPPRDQQTDIYLTLDRRRPQSIIYYWPVSADMDMKLLLKINCY